jgi:leucyl aminopeptidase
MALGENLAGIFTNNDSLNEELTKIGNEIQVDT